MHAHSRGFDWRRRGALVMLRPSADARRRRAPIWLRRPGALVMLRPSADARRRRALIWLRRLACSLALILTPAVAAQPAAAQMGAAAQPDTLYEIRLADGTTVYGQVDTATADRIVLTTASGVRIETTPAQIRSMRLAPGRLVDGEYWMPDPLRSRLFFAPTARAVPAGEGYVGVFLIALPFVAVGITDRVTIAGGAPLLFGTLDPFYIAPKIQLVSHRSAALAVGVLSFLSTRDESRWTAGIAYGIGTIGTADQAITAGLGFGYAGDDFSGRPAFAIGAESRVSRRAKLMTENYFIAGETLGLLSGGMRFFGERISADVGVLALAGGEEWFCCAPIVNFSYAFGQR